MRRPCLGRSAVGALASAMLALLLGCQAGSADQAGAEDLTPTPGSAPSEGGTVIAPLPAESLQLSGAAGSLDRLVERIETGLEAGDLAGLLQLMVTEDEYRRILYPAFPASRPPISADFATIWVLHYPDAYRGLKRLLRKYEGRDLEILAVRFDRPDQDFVNFVLHETGRVDLVLDGERQENVRLFGSVFRVGNQWKLLSYPDDP